ncbi:GTPase domain-containing protein [Rothia sp. ARF10]|nr:GTPase domain-containing protein [Rothia sp. ARF10]
MTEPIWIPLAIETAGAVWKTTEALRLHERLADFFKHKPYLLVLGSTGVGKTNFLRSLDASAGLVEAIASSARTEASSTQVVRVEKQPFRVVDTPGQTAHQADRLRIVREALAEPPVRVLNVVSYGFHEYLQNAHEAVADEAPIPQFLARHRETEIAAVREWVPLIGDRESTKWVLTVVTKADLWWPQHDEVLRHYSEGEYARELKAADPSIVHAVVPYCSVIHQFYGRALLPGNFDDEKRLTTNLHFLDQLLRLE